MSFVSVATIIVNFIVDGDGGSFSGQRSISGSDDAVCSLSVGLSRTDKDSTFCSNWQIARAFGFRGCVRPRYISQYRV